MISSLNSSSISNISLFIPHVFPNFSKQYIADVFERHNIGMVDHIDLVAKKDRYGKSYNAAYVHFKYWYSGSITENFQARVKNPKKEARIVYDDPWYWIILENTTKKYEPQARKECVEPPVQLLKIAPGLSEIVLSPQMADEIDNLISELYNSPMDLSCEINSYADECLYEQPLQDLLRNICDKVLAATTLEEAKQFVSVAYPFGK